MPIYLLSFIFVRVRTHIQKGLPYMLERAGLDVQQGQSLWNAESKKNPYAFLYYFCIQFFFFFCINFELI